MDGTKTNHRYNFAQKQKGLNFSPFTSPLFNANNFFAFD